MRDLKSLADRQAQQLRAKERIAQRLSERTRKPKTDRPDPATSAPAQPEAAEELAKPWAKERVRSTPFGLYASGTASTELFLQPWAKALVNVALEAADSGGVHLCLLWPVEVAQAALLHGIASLQRNSSGDFQGLRTVFYPGSHSTRLALQSVTVDRKTLTVTYRSKWSTGSEGTVFHSATRSKSFEAVLAALNEIEIWNNPTANPPIGALVPCFIFDPGSDEWRSSARNQLDAALVKVQKRANRKDARESVAPEWGNATSAPGALMVIHNANTKRGWKQAFAAKSLERDGRPDLLVMDATMSAARTNTNAVRRIPDVLKSYLEARAPAAGALIITDDPRTFFGLRAGLSNLRIEIKEHVWAGEGDDALLSSTPVADDWTPATRDNARCRIAIVDKEAGEIAARFHQLAEDVGGDDHPGHRVLMEAFLFILRLSNLPAGIKDLAAELEDLNGDAYANAKYSWSGIVTNLRSAVDSGLLSGKQLAVDRAINRAAKLVEAWVESTPMAERLLADVLDHARLDRKSLVIVLPNRNYVALARRFLQRRVGEEWPDIEGRIEWHTLTSFAFMLRDQHRHRHYTIVGLNPRVLRLLLTHPDLPHGTHVLLSYKQADAALKTLRAMKAVDAFKPYRGRVGVLEQELGRRLEEMPPLPAFGKLGEFAMTFDLSESAGTATSGEQAYFRFELDGARSMYASGWVYRYDPEEGTGFRRTPAKDIQVGQLLFDMNDALRTKFEEALELSTHGSAVSHYPARTFLKLYHDDVQARCALYFPDAGNRAALARAIWEKMVSIDETAKEFRSDRIQYWLDLGDHADQRPHAAKDAKFFRLFCAALGMSGENAEQNLIYVRNARRLNQDIGRELSARYAEILFHPESAIAYQKVPPAMIGELQREAVMSVFRVTHITPPAASRR